MRAGPKAAVDPSPLPWRPKSSGAARFAAFCVKFLLVPKGTGALGPLRLRRWQVELSGSVLDRERWPRIVGWMLARGNGKTTLVAALGLYVMLTGGEGATVVVCAVDERQARLTFDIARRMVELNEELSSRIQVFQNRLVVPDRGASFHCLPAEPKALEGLDFTLAILDEAGVIDRRVFEVVALASGKRAESTVLAIGTPSADPDSVLASMRAYALEHPDDDSQVWVEHSAAGHEDHPTSCEHCWALANPALDDFLHRDALAALQPPKMREAAFRRARLCQPVIEGETSLFSPGVWDALGTGEGVPDGENVVIGLDGSYSSDSTALVVGTVSERPHFDVAGLWEAPAGDDSWRVPIEDVEQTIREACERWTVVEVAADPFRWQRSLAVLAGDGVPVVEFNWSTARITAATSDFYAAVNAGECSHSGDPRLARHIQNAHVIEDTRGIRIGKERRGSGRHIDLAAAVLMCHSRATWRAQNRPPRRRARSFRR